MQFLHFGRDCIYIFVFETYAISIGVMKVVLYLFCGILLLLASCKNKVENAKSVTDSTKPLTTLADQKSNPPMSPFYRQLSTDYCMGKFEPKSHLDFTIIPEKYADRAGLYLRKDVLAAYVKMYEAALADGLKLQIRSATRNFAYQKGIWERKWTGATTLSDGTNVATDITDPKEKALKILEYSSMPGTSRHHWGTDIDLNAFNNAFFEEGAGKEIYDWLTNHASSFGFCQPYTPKDANRPHGYNEEKWHWTYQPLAKEITHFAQQNLQNEMLDGFKGAKTAVEIDVVAKYVLGINPSCK